MGSKDNGPRLRLLTREERKLIEGYRADHADYTLRARVSALGTLLEISRDPKADDADRVKAADALLRATSSIAPQVTVNVGQVTTGHDQASATELVIARLDALALQAQTEAERAAEPDPMADVFGDIPGSTGWPALAELTPAAEPVGAEPVVVDALPDPTVVDTGAIPLGDGAPVDTMSPDVGWLSVDTGSDAAAPDRSARVTVGRLGNRIETTGKQLGTGLPSRRAGR